LLPFDEIDPRFKVLTVDGVTPLDNRFDPATYPLISMLQIRGEGMALLIPHLSGTITPTTNRNASALTTLIMTGVTAMSRGTADAIERNYLTYPATIISATLAAADITHISNEVPFLDDCVVNNTLNNLVLCSHTSYWEVLEAVGTDIVGLSGNHVNDFGYEGARRSLAFYRENNIPIYGSGLNLTEACEPLLWEHNGNTFAFVAVLAFGPATAWATDELPGACYYYDHKARVLTLVEELAAEVDVVAVELQYLETYEPSPTFQQVVEFREVRAAGADIVTGVQSHVPQAWEPYGLYDPGGPGTISYGLGNLFFDQMWSWETRTEQMARHTIYEGRVLNTEILTAVLEDFAQPRWATPEERADILNRVFNAAPPPQ
jgi:poly-gamma-glutamate synthesis protein (capsule biosynthesis protein)